MKISAERLLSPLKPLRPHAERARDLALRAGEALKEQPRYIRTFAMLPLLLTWFAALHHDAHRSAAYRGLFLSVLFFVASSLVYFAFDSLRANFAASFALHLVFLLLQTAVSAAYIFVSARLAYAEYTGRPVHAETLDRWKAMILEWI